MVTKAETGLYHYANLTLHKMIRSTLTSLKCPVKQNPEAGQQTNYFALSVYLTHEEFKLAQHLARSRI